MQGHRKTVATTLAEECEKKHLRFSKFEYIPGDIGKVFWFVSEKVINFFTAACWFPSLPGKVRRQTVQVARFGEYRNDFSGIKGLRW